MEPRHSESHHRKGTIPLQIALHMNRPSYSNTSNLC